MKRKFYTVYKTINLINGRFYIGAHATDDPNDFYMGSGSIIYQAFKKYGYRNFKKEILAIFDNPEDMFNCEIDTIAKFQGDPLLYNLDKGGKGGFHYLTQEQEQRLRDKIAIKKRSKEGRDLARNNFYKSLERFPNFLDNFRKESRLGFNRKLKNDPSFRKRWKENQSKALREFHSANPEFSKNLWKRIRQKHPNMSKGMNVGNKNPSHKTRKIEYEKYKDQVIDLICNYDIPDFYVLKELGIKGKFCNWMKYYESCGYILKHKTVLIKNNTFRNKTTHRYKSIYYIPNTIPKEVEDLLKYEEQENK
jgi:hypothetical protein